LGNFFEGEFEFGNRKSGVFRFASGDMFEGDWADDAFAKGKYCYTQGKAKVYDGEWLHGLWHGRGSVKYTDGGSYQGSFIAGQMSDHGVYRFPCGDEYEGTYVADAITGEGTYRFSSGHVYTGEFLDGIRHVSPSLRVRRFQLLTKSAHSNVYHIVSCNITNRARVYFD
jgi:hypothetical protein